MLPRVLHAVMSLSARRPLAVGGLVLVLALAGSVAASGLQPTSSDDTYVSRSSPTFKASQAYHERFGEDAVYVLISEPVSQLVLTSDLARIIALERCLAGIAPRGMAPRGGPDGPCARLARTRPARVVFGPGTFIDTSVTQIQAQIRTQQQAAQRQGALAAQEARRIAAARGLPAARQQQVAEEAQALVQSQFVAAALKLATTYGLTSIPKVNDPAFVSKLVFDSTKPTGTPKARFSSLFPTRDSGLIQVRMRDGLSEDARRTAISDIRAAVAMPTWRLPNGSGKYVVTGAPVIVADLTTSIVSSARTLLIGALLVMTLTLAVVFRTRRRLAPLLVALAAAGITFGMLRLTGGRVTMASIAALPILIGLAVDYAIQLQSRLQEEREGDADGDLPKAVDGVARTGAPTVAIAATATAAGFLVLLLSPVPMVRGFGVLLVGGVVVAVLCALTLGTAIQALGARGQAGAAATSLMRPAVNGARAILRHNAAIVRARRGARAVGHRVRAGGGGASLRLATARPGRVLALGAVLALAGWGLDTQATVQSDVRQLVPQSLPALQDLNALQDSTGVGGEIDVLVTSNRLTDPQVLRWMSDYQRRLVKAFGFSAERGCGRAPLCPAFSLPDLFRSGLPGQTAQSIQTLLDAVPPYFSQGVLTADRRSASLAFGIKLMPLDRQQEVIERMRAELDPPAGVKVQIAGLPVLAAQANADVSSPGRRVLMLVAGLLAVGLVLLALLRSARRALLPLVPIVLATGWSALLLALTGIPLNPMSVTLGALVIAISTEFSVLLGERYRAERVAGAGVEEALRRAYASTGVAVLASGVTAVAGFAVLVLSDIRMLRDFGAVTVIDLGVSLLGVLVVLPAVLVLAERRDARAIVRPVSAPSGPGRRLRRPASPEVGAG